MSDFSDDQEQPEEALLRMKNELLKTNQAQMTVLEEWAAMFLLVQQLEKAAGTVGRPLFHEEPRRAPLILPGRATVWPVELKPLWHLTYRP